MRNARLLIALAAPIVIVTAITLPVMLYFDSLEQQGRLTTTDWPKWVAQIIVVMLIAATLFLAKIILYLMHRRWPENPVDEQEEQKPHWLKTPPKE